MEKNIVYRGSKHGALIGEYKSLYATRNYEIALSYAGHDERYVHTLDISELKIICIDEAIEYLKEAGEWNDYKADKVNLVNCGLEGGDYFANICNADGIEDYYGNVEIWRNGQDIKII